VSWREIGRAQVIEDAEPDEEAAFEEFVRSTGIYGLSYLAERILDEHYPADVFQWKEVQYGVTWGGEHGGEDIGPGVKWAALLRMAIAELDRMEKANDA
jgi:hypothetical protein